MTKHGHVTPRPDGTKERCGGITLCQHCQAELRLFKADQEDKERREAEEREVEKDRAHRRAADEASTPYVTPDPDPSPMPDFSMPDFSSPPDSSGGDYSGGGGDSGGGGSSSDY